MAKRTKPKGRSMRNGNAPSPYTKYHKQPYLYSAEYNAWKRARLSNKPAPAAKVKKHLHLEYKEAAE